MENLRELHMDEMDKVSGGVSSDDLKNQLNEALEKAGPCIYCGTAIRLGDGSHTFNLYVDGGVPGKCRKCGKKFTLTNSGFMY